LPDVFTNEQIDLLSHLYDAEVAYQDEAIGDLLAMLDALGVRDNTWIVIMADHGELFGEQGMVYHTASSHYSLLHIPLLVRPPGGADGRRIGGPVQPVDVFETLVDVAGVRMPEEVARAYRLPTDRNQPNRRTVAIAETHGASIAGLSIAQRADMQANLTHWLTWVTSVYADGWLLEETETGPRGLFHVAEDPFMRENRLQDAREKLAELSAALAAFARSASDRTTLAFGAH
jgi:arylsulfatase A-like enzyme